MNEAQTARLEEMARWLTDNSMYADMICGVEIYRTELILKLIDVLEEKGYYELLLVFLKKSKDDYKVSHALDKYLAEKALADCPRRGISHEVGEICRLIRAELQ